MTERDTHGHNYQLPSHATTELCDAKWVSLHDFAKVTASFSLILQRL